MTKKKLKIDIDILRERSLFIATPMYGGMCNGSYHTSCVNLQEVCCKLGLKTRFFHIFNESLITRARNYCVDEFMRSDFTHMIFIDSDIGFDPMDVIKFLSLDEDILCGPYPKKTIAWEKVHRACGNPDLQDHLKENPHWLENIAGDFVANFLGSFRLDDLIEISEGGTGFMMIKKEALQKYIDAYPEMMFKPDHARSKNFNGDRMIHASFDCIIDPVSKRYLSEDYFFCRKAREIGISVKLAPWVVLNHTGAYVYKGNFQNTLALGLAPSIDEQDVRKVDNQLKLANDGSDNLKLKPKEEEVVESEEESKE